MIEFNDKLFLYQEMFPVWDYGFMIKNVPEEIITKVEEPVKKNVFYIKFAEKIPSNIEDSSNPLFKSFNFDEKFMRKVVIKDGVHPKDPKKKIKYLYFPNVCIPKCFSFHMTVTLLAFLFNINHKCIIISLDFENGNQDLCSNTPRDFAGAEKGLVFPLQISTSHEENLVRFNIFCMGCNKNPIIKIKPSEDTSIGNYEEIFYKEYYLMLQRFKNILDNTEKLKVPRLKLSINYSQIKVMLCYHAPRAAITKIDISKLFGIHHVWNYSKIYIHSDNIDNFLSNPRPIQYVKTSSNTSNAFKGVEPLFNTCALYSGTNISDGISLHHIEIFPDMAVNLVFTNINASLTWENISTILKEWVDANYIDVLKKTKINEAVYNLDFKYEYYIPYFAHMNGAVNVLGLTVSDIENLNDILQQETCNMKFKTRTSIEFNSYEFWSMSAATNYGYLKGVHEFITAPIAYKELLPNVHVGVNDDGGVLTFKNVNSYDELLFTLGFVMGNFKKLNMNDASQSKAITVADNSELDIEAIRKKSAKFGKGLLKILEKMDPRLFGPRKINKGVRSFSGLCQKQKQRVVPITKDEYEYLQKIVPASVVNLQNQSYPDQRIYLFCPYKKYPFLNYHTFPHQLCIVRCTTKSSNKTQYNFCAKSLGAEHVADIKNRYENQTITLYNPLITKGRKCKLPEEWKMILVNYVLIKLNIDSSIMQYCREEYDKTAFIIKRDVMHERYLILTEYNANDDYVLVIEDVIGGEYFLVIDEKTSEPLIFSKCPELMKFFVENIRKTNEQYNFFNFLEKILDAKLSDKYELTVKNILAHVKQTFGLKYVYQGTYILGVIWKEKLYFTPRLYWNFENTVGNELLFKAIDDVLNDRLKFPLFTDLDKSLIKEVYVDYEDGKCHMVRFNNVNVWIQPYDLTAQLKLEHDVITFDRYAKLMSQYNINLEKLWNLKETQIKILDIAEVLRNYIYIYLINNDGVNVDEILKKLVELGVVYDGTTFIDYVNKRYKMNISWRTSKINKDDFKEYFEKYADLNPNEIIKTIYRKFQDELTFKTGKTETISSKIITV